MKPITFSPPDITEEEINAVAEVLRSGWITTGPKTKELEKKLAEYTGASGVVCLNSSTAAMELTLSLLGIGPGDEVITSAYTYTATCSVICHVGATPVIVDVSKDSFEIDYDAISEAITEKTKAIMPVDLGGVMCDYDRLFEIVNAKRDIFVANNDIQRIWNRIVILADSAHGLGASYKGRMSGSVADFTAFSFHAVKNVTTAEGGAVAYVLPDVEGLPEKIYKQYQLMSLHGQSKDALAKNKPGLWEYDIVAPYYKNNMTDIMAAIGLVQLGRYPGMLERRKEIVAMYEEGLKGVTSLKHADEFRQGSRHLFLARVTGKTREQCNEIIEMMAERGIALNVHYKPLPMLTAYKNLGFDIKDYPNAYDVFHNEISFPLHTKLTDEQIRFVIDNFNEVVELV